MRVDFYRIELTDSRDFKDILSRVDGLPDDDSRTGELTGVPFRLQKLSGDPNHRYWDGDIIRIRMNDVPVICSLGGDLDEVDLKEDEGMGEETAFRYDVKTKVLAIQRNRLGVSASKWGSFFELFSQHDAAITPSVVLEQSAIKILARMQSIRRVHIRYAGTTNASLMIDPSAGTVDTINDLAAEAPVMEVTLSMGRQRGGFVLQRARSVIADIYHRATGGDGEHRDISRIDVKGTLDDDTPAEMNLLEYTMKESVDVSSDPKKKRRLYGDRKQGVKTAWDRRRGELETLFP